MADDPQQPGGAPRDRAEPDQTKQFPAFTEPGEPAFTEPGEPAAGPPPGDPTVLLPAAQPWAGRAEVPAPDAVGIPEAEPGGWPEPGERSRGWWLPVGLALLTLLLFGLLGFGLWLALRDGTEDSAPGAPPGVPTGTSTQSGPASPAPTTASPSPPRTTPEEVAVPRLAALDTAQATAILDDAGLTYRLVSRTSTNQPPGTVIETDPPQGAVVEKGRQITLVVAAAPPAPSPSPSPSATSASPPSPSPSG